jgi:ribokinase
LRKRLRDYKYKHETLKMKPHITVVGSVNMDLVFRTPRMPGVGETLHGHDFHQIPGGKGANQAVAAARLGADVTFIGAIGDDGFGDFSRACLNTEQINLSHLSTIPSTATGVAGILVTDKGENSIVLAAGANACLTPLHIDAAKLNIESTQVLICQLETPIESVRRAIEIAHAKGVKVILNPAPAQPLPDELLRQVDYLIVNETEATQLSEIEVTDRASAELASKKLLQRGARSVLLTMGEHGALISGQEESHYIDAIKVAVVDTTAAGDTFVGAFSVGIANGLSTLQASREAQYAAALTVTKLGAQTSIPHRQDVQAFMASSKTD